MRLALHPLSLHTAMKEQAPLLGMNKTARYSRKALLICVLRLAQEPFLQACLLSKHVRYPLASMKHGRPMSSLCTKAQSHRSFQCMRAPRSQQHCAQSCLVRPHCFLHHPQGAQKTPAPQSRMGSWSCTFTQNYTALRSTMPEMTLTLACGESKRGNFRQTYVYMYECALTLFGNLQSARRLSSVATHI